MTLRGRNRLLKLLIFFSAFWFLAILFLFIFGLANEAFIYSSQDDYRVCVFGFLKFFNFNYIGVLSSILFFSLTAPVVALLIYFVFEKTSSLEIFFFMGFIFACLTESLRLFIPLREFFDLSTGAVLSLNRVIFAGRLLSTVSFFFSAYFSSNEDRKTSDRNFLIMFVLCVFVASFFPFSTNKFTSAFTLLWGSRIAFSFYCFCAVLSTVAILHYKGRINNQHEYFSQSWGYLCIILGYYILRSSDSLIPLIASAALLYFGIFKYLKAIHSLYT